MRSLVLLVLLPLVGSCMFLRAPEVPMASVFYAAPAGAAEGLVVLLPGFGDAPEAFERHGFVDRIQQANPALDVIAVDAHFGYYRSRTVLDRLDADVIDPVADRYQQIWLTGISMGGFGSSIYALENPGRIAGLILLAPYMGSHDVIAAVDRAGGLANWIPPEIGSIEEEDRRKFYELWAWYREYARRPETLPKLYIGWGEDDDLDIPNGFVAATLPADQRMTLPGGHAWTVWQPLFDELVTRALAPAEAGGSR